MRCFSKISNVFRKRSSTAQNQPLEEDIETSQEKHCSDTNLVNKTRTNNNTNNVGTTANATKANYIVISTTNTSGTDKNINDNNENEKHIIQLTISDECDTDDKINYNKSDPTSPSLGMTEKQKQQQQILNINKNNKNRNKSSSSGSSSSKNGWHKNSDEFINEKTQKISKAENNTATYQGEQRQQYGNVADGSSSKNAKSVTSAIGDENQAKMTPKSNTASINNKDNKKIWNKMRLQKNTDKNIISAHDDGVDEHATIFLETIKSQPKDVDEGNRKSSSKSARKNIIKLSTAADDSDTEGSFIEEYKNLLVEKRHLIRGSYDMSEVCHMEEALNLSTLKKHSLHTPNSMRFKSDSALFHFSPHSLAPSQAPSIAKTPEEIEYEQQFAAETVDVMTPLPGSSMHSQKPFALGRNVQPEIAEVIRNLDANALRINNLTNEDKLELMRRFETQQKRHNNSRKQRTHQPALPSDSDLVATPSTPESDEVELRPKHYATMGLYARRQPKRPKLLLQVQRICGGYELKQASKMTKEAEEDINERNLMDLKYPTVLPPNPQLKALLVFHKTDNFCEVLTEACHRQQIDVTLVKSKEAALDTLHNSTGAAESFHLIIIDARSSKNLDAEYITRSIRHTNGHHFTTIIAVVKKSFFEKDDVLIALLDAGVNRCIAETTNVSICNIEVKQILHSIVRPHNVMSTQQALYTALHRLKEVLIITDDVLRIQYANKSAERLLNMRLDEIISKPLADIFISDVESISAHGKSIREFDGILTVRRKSQDGIPMHVRVVPVACIGRTPTHFVFNFDVPGGQTDFIATLPQPKEAPRGSLHSIRRGSFDVRSVASDGLRRTSLAKLTSLPLEAPITKIINLLSQVQENCSADEARLIDKVLEFLKREGLYSPQMKELRPDDPIATDLIGALLTGPSLYSSRRSSNDSIIRVSTSRPSGIMPAKMKATPLIMELLEESLSWEFDIFKLEDITEKHPLLYLGMEMFRRFDFFATFNVEESVCKGWLAVIEANYQEQNSYHNSTHAADVMQATGIFITQLAAKDMVMDRMDEATALIAAATHDIDHPGRSSAFLCNSNSPLAVLYNDLTVLESHHAATTFKLTLADDKINIFKNLDKDTYKSVRSTIIDMILATEMTRHFEHLAKFVSVFGTDVEPKDIVQNEEESSILIRRMLIKVADVSNPARPMPYCVEWSRRIAEEYFTQTDEEKAKGLPIVMPMFDRATCSIPKSQIGFIEYIIQDMMHAWDSFIDMPQLITQMQINYSQWKKFEEQGIHTLADIKTKQISLNAKKSTYK